MTNPAMSTSRDAFEAYWSERQLRTHRYTDRPCPDDWGLAFKADAEAAWQASRRDALEEAAKACEAEYLNEPQAGTEDIAYDYAVRDCAAAIRALASGTKEGQEP